MKKLDLNRKEDFFVKATIVVNNKEITDIPCKIYLPERITERPYIVLKPEQKIILDWKIKFNPINFDKTSSIKTIIELDDVYVIDSQTNYWGKNLSECTIYGEPEKLCIIDNIKPEQSSKTNAIFWISDNSFLSPFMSCETSYSGRIEYNRIRNFNFSINSEIKLLFDKNFKSKSYDNGDLVQWSYLVACTELDVSTTEIEEKILPIIDDFLLIASFASRQKTACLGWTASDEKSHVTFYRCDITLPKNNEKHNIDDGIIDIKNYEIFVSTCYTSFLVFENKLALRNAIYAIFPSQTVELSFLHLFSGLESLILDFRRREDCEYILSKEDFSKLRNHLKKSIKASDNPKLEEEQRSSIYKKLGELNRISLEEAFDIFCQKYKLEVSDLWPVFKNNQGVGLADIRNKLIHGDPFPSDLFNPLIIANEHLRFILERSLVAVLGYNVEKTKLRKDYLRNCFTIIREMDACRKKMSDYISRSNSI